MKISLMTNSEAETYSLAESLGKFLVPGMNLFLDGDLAAGKTVFAKGVGKGLGIIENIKSPSYTLLCMYEGRLPFYHFDAYNLSGIDDFFDLGFDEYPENGGVVLVEWADVIREGFPYGHIDIKIDKIPENEEQRRLTFTAEDGSEEARILKNWRNHEDSCL